MNHVKMLTKETCEFYSSTKRSEKCEYVGFGICMCTSCVITELKWMEINYGLVFGSKSFPHR